MDSLTPASVQTAEEMQRQLVSRATEDADFRAQLLADPRGLMKQEFGIDVPEFINFRVHENDPNEFHLVLPPIGGNYELDEERLEAVAAGLSCCC